MSSLFSGVSTFLICEYIYGQLLETAFAVDGFQALQSHGTPRIRLVLKKKRLAQERNDAMGYYSHNRMSID